MFEKFIGIDYSGSGTPLTRTPGLQVYVATNDRLPRRMNPPLTPAGRNRNWCRKEVAEWLIEQANSDKPFIAGLEAFVHPDCRPDLTLLFDVPLAESRARLARAEAGGRALDKFESERQDFFARVRAAYLERAAAEPQRVRVVDSSRPIEDVRDELARLLAALSP